MTYKIERRFLSTWDDAEWTDADDAGERPTRFPSVELAQAALEDFFADVRRAVVAGNMDVEETRADYRVVEARD